MSISQEKRRELLRNRFNLLLATNPDYAAWISDWDYEDNWTCYFCGEHDLSCDCHEVEDQTVDYYEIQEELER